MKSRNISKDDDLIDIGKLFKSFWKDKFIILVSSAIISVIGYFYGASLPKYFETTVKIRSAPKSIFKEYNDLFIYNLETDISADEYFNKEFLLLLDSSETLIKFFQQNTEYAELSPDIYQGTVSINQNRKTKKITPYTINYSLKLIKKFKNQEFLNKYVLFVKKETETEFKKQINNLLVSKINDHKKNLEVAIEINLENPILTSMVDGNSVVNEPEALFYRGSKVLEKQLMHLKDLKSKINEYSLNYNLILDKASPIAQISTPAKNFIIPSFFVGMILSFFILLVRNSYKRS